MLDIVLALLLGWSVATVQQQPHCCSTKSVDNPFRLPFTQIHSDPFHQEPDSVEIKWVKTSLSGIHPQLHGMAMLSKSRKRCVVLLPEIERDGPDVYVLGHEVLHCYKGIYHLPAIGEAMEFRADAIDVAREEGLKTWLPTILPADAVAEIERFLEDGA